MCQVRRETRADCVIPAIGPSGPKPMVFKTHDIPQPSIAIVVVEWRMAQQ